MNHWNRVERRCGSWRWIGGLLILLPGLVLVSDAMAEVTLRCGSRLISRGALQIEVLRACGEPATREYLGSLSEGWLYGRQGQISRMVIFRNARVSQIKSGPRL
mgnify:CR=1 FL=1